MSQLAFDKEGQPFQLLPQTESLWVRRFRNPGARGTCEVLYDEEDELLHVDSDASLADLRHAVGQVPGLYRLDQCDDTGEVIGKATPAYVTIDPPRNGLLSGGAADPLVIVRELAAINADVSKTLADRAAGMMEAMAGCMRDMRAALGGDANQRLLGLIAKVAREKDASDNDDGDDEEDDDEPEDEEDTSPEPPDPFAALGPLAPMVAAMAPKIGEAIAAKVLELMTQFAKAPPAAATATTTATASAPTSAPTPSGATSDGAAAGASSAKAAPTPSAATPSPPTAPDPTIATEPAVGAATTEATVPAPTAPTASAGVRNGVPTPEQLAHLLAIRAVLSAREVAIVDGVIARMDGRTCAEWIGELSSMSVDQAVARVRSLIPGPQRGDEREE